MFFVCFWCWVGCGGGGGVGGGGGGKGAGNRGQVNVLVILVDLNIVSCIPDQPIVDFYYCYVLEKCCNYCKCCLQSSLSCAMYVSLHHLRNRKHVPCLYWVIETRVEVWENKKCCGNTSRRQVFPQLFWVLPNFHECFNNSIETQRTCFSFF